MEFAVFIQTADAKASWLEMRTTKPPILQCRGDNLVLYFDFSVARTWHTLAQ